MVYLTLRQVYILLEQPVVRAVAILVQNVAVWLQTCWKVVRVIYMSRFQ